MTPPLLPSAWTLVLLLLLAWDVRLVLGRERPMELGLLARGLAAPATLVLSGTGPSPRLLGVGGALLAAYALFNVLAYWMVEERDGPYVPLGLVGNGAFWCLLTLATWGVIA